MQTNFDFLILAANQKMPNETVHITRENELTNNDKQKRIFNVCSTFTNAIFFFNILYHIYLYV